MYNISELFHHLELFEMLSSNIFPIWGCLSGEKKIILQLRCITIAEGVVGLMIISYYGFTFTLFVSIEIL